jgi:hypothetical protein
VLADSGKKVNFELSVPHHEVGWAQTLVPTGKAALSGISVVTRHGAAELAIGKEADQLGEDATAFVHPFTHHCCRYNQVPLPRLRAIQIAANLDCPQLAAPE